MRTLKRKSKKLLNFWETLAENMGWHGHSTLESMQLKRKEHTWLLVVKVKRNNVSWVCFVEGEEIDDCIEVFSLFMLQKSNVGVKWIKSKY